MVLEFWLRKNSKSRLKLRAKVYLKSHRGRRSDLKMGFGNTLHRQKKGPWSLRESGKENVPRKGGGERCEWVYYTEKAH